MFIICKDMAWFKLACLWIHSRALIFQNIHFATTPVSILCCVKILPCFPCDRFCIRHFHWRCLINYAILWWVIVFHQSLSFHGCKLHISMLIHVVNSFLKRAKEHHHCVKAIFEFHDTTNTKIFIVQTHMAYICKHRWQIGKQNI